ncbi:MAG: thiamine phosphate synthase [Sedimentisphaerales bacterium]|nr:thiamine phosphate synthase [Sedimentisphaerales bacterium]
MNKAVFRIIDANFNRAREGLRIAEEFCRFGLNNEALSSRCKEIRHKLSKTVNQLGSEQLITSRDTENDIGCGIEVAGQMRRDSFEDCVTAGFARSSEALRVLAEAGATIEAKIAESFEKMRYDCYVLEKDIAMSGFTALKFAKVRLYGIITAEGCPDVSALIKACAKGGVDCLQLRAKKMTDAKFFSLAQEFVDLCKHHNVISIINDRVDIAVAAEADGIHLGQEDIPLEKTGKCQIKPLITGVSTHSMAELKKAVEKGPCYVGLGSVFATNTKEGVGVCGVEYICKAIEFLKDKPVEAVAIGGINEENIDEVLKAGAKKVAVSSCICKAKDPAEVCKKLKDKILQYYPQ